MQLLAIVRHAISTCWRRIRDNLNTFHFNVFAIQIYSSSQSPTPSTPSSPLLSQFPLSFGDFSTFTVSVDGNSVLILDFIDSRHISIKSSTKIANGKMMSLNSSECDSIQWNIIEEIYKRQRLLS